MANLNQHVVDRGGFSFSSPAGWSWQRRPNLRLTCARCCQAAVVQQDLRRNLRSPGKDRGPQALRQTRRRGRIPVPTQPRAALPPIVQGVRRSLARGGSGTIREIEKLFWAGIGVGVRDRRRGLFRRTAWTPCPQGQSSVFYLREGSQRQAVKRPRPRGCRTTVGGFAEASSRTFGRSRTRSLRTPA